MSEVTMDNILAKMHEIYEYELIHGQPDVWIPPAHLTPEQMAGILRFLYGNVNLQELGIPEIPDDASE